MSYGSIESILYFSYSVSIHPSSLSFFFTFLSVLLCRILWWMSLWSKKWIVTDTWAFSCHWNVKDKCMKDELWLYLFILLWLDFGLLVIHFLQKIRSVLISLSSTLCWRKLERILIILLKINCLLLRTVIEMPSFRVILFTWSFSRDVSSSSWVDQDICHSILLSREVVWCPVAWNVSHEDATHITGNENMLYQ